MRILLVDDDALILSALTRRFRAHDVTCANGAEAALRLLREGHDFEAIVCDLWMPGMNGSALYDELAMEHPPFARRFIFMSAQCPGDSEETGSYRGRPFLRKPFSREQLECALGLLTR